MQGESLHVFLHPARPWETVFVPLVSPTGVLCGPGHIHCNAGTRERVLMVGGVTWQFVRLALFFYIGVGSRATCLLGASKPPPWAPLS